MTTTPELPKLHRDGPGVYMHTSGWRVEKVQGVGYSDTYANREIEYTTWLLIDPRGREVAEVPTKATAVAVLATKLAQEGNEMDTTPEMCKWFALCDHPATQTRKHPVLGAVPICDRCEQKLVAMGA